MIQLVVKEVGREEWRANVRPPVRGQEEARSILIGNFLEDRFLVLGESGKPPRALQEGDEETLLPVLVGGSYDGPRKGEVTAADPQNRNWPIHRPRHQVQHL